MNYFIANFKANISPNEATGWLRDFNYQKSDDEIILCPPFLTIPFFTTIKKEGIKVGSQDVSRFDNGAYTGEVTAKMLDDVVDYVLIGHSERKKYFGETLDDVAIKLAKTAQAQIKAILCLNKASELETLMANSLWNEVDKNQLIFVYEPSSAISGGGDLHPDSKENIASEVAKIKQIVDLPVLYGGSVSEENIHDLIPDNVSGVLVGQKSLSPWVFAKLIENYPRS